MPWKKLTTDEFVERARKAHGDRFDYSRVRYVNARTKCEIVCRTHGVFQQSPNHHLAGIGCPACGGNAKSTTDEFIEKARKSHGDKFDYSRVRYVNAHTKCNLVCRTHGVFQQSPANHLTGRGCPACGGTVKSTTDEFIEKARNLHGDQYDYSQVQYLKSKTKCKIVCRTHGVFQQYPHRHLAGNGCTQCGADSGAKKRTDSLLDFVTKAESIHGDKYDYTTCVYVNAHTKCDIICKTHGVFQQTPDNHLRGKGCPRCNESKGEKMVAKLLTKYNLTFDPQKTFEGLRHKQPLKCDFYVPEINTVIEYQGTHHYGIGIHADRDTEGLCQIRDQIKRDFCKANGIHLIEIPYWEDTETFLLGALLPILRLHQRA
jgi:hypothetical protein